VVLVTKARVHRRAFWILAMVGLVGMAAVVDKKFVDRMFTIGDVVETDEDADASARSRMAIYEAQVRMALDYPMGAGHRGTATLSPYYIEQRWLTTLGGHEEAARSSHNTFMTTLVEQGVFGAMLFAALLIWLSTAVLRLRRMAAWSDVDPALTTMAGSIAGALVVVIVAGTATDYLLAEVQFWLFAALVSAIQLIEKARVSALPDASPAGTGAVQSGHTATSVRT
jgi:O-antigen ligase